MPKTMMTIMMMMMMIMTDPFTTNLVVKGPVVKGSVVKGATSVVTMMVTMMRPPESTVARVGDLTSTASSDPRHH